MLHLIFIAILCHKPIVRDVETEAQRPEITYLSHVARNVVEVPRFALKFFFDNTGESDTPSSL